MHQVLDPVSKTALNMLTKYGGYSTLVSNTYSSYDDSTSIAAKVTKKYQVKTLAFDYLTKHSGSTADANSLIRAGDKQIFLLPSVAPAPVAVVDSLIHNGRVYNIVFVKDLNPSGSKSILYELFVRE